MHMFQFSRKLACSDLSKAYALMFMSFAACTNNTLATNIASKMSDKVETMTSDLTPFNDDEISDVKKVASIDATSVKTSSLLSQTAIRQIFNSPHQSTTTNSNAATDCERPTDMQMPFSTQLLRMVTGNE